jgi:hypothetical protein
MTKPTTNQLISISAIVVAVFIAGPISLESRQFQKCISDQKAEELHPSFDDNRHGMAVNYCNGGTGAA